MRVVLLGDSHLARVQRDLGRLASSEVDTIVNAAVGGAVAPALRLQALDVPVGVDDCVVVSIGTNDAAPWSTVSTETFATALDDLLELRVRRWVLLAPPGLDVALLGTTAGWTQAQVDTYAAVAVARFAAVEARVVDSPRLLAPLGSRAFDGDGVHLTGAAYDVLLPAVRDALT